MTESIVFDDIELPTGPAPRFTAEDARRMRLAREEYARNEGQHEIDYERWNDDEEEVE